MTIKNRILFVSSFAGSSSYLNALIDSLKVNNYCIAAKGIGSQVFLNNKKKIDYDFNESEYNIKKMLSFENPKLVIMVSQFRNSIEKDFINICKEKLIKVVSFIEHYSFYQERFSLIDNQDYSIIEPNIYIPDYIIVNDIIAKEEAVNSGLPEKKIIILGNLYLETIYKRKPKKIDKYVWRRSLGISCTFRRIIVFISEDYKQDMPIDSPLYEGFNEYEILNDILELIEDNDMVLIKLHPSEDETKYKSFEAVQNLNVIKNTDLGDLILCSDVIIGMGSMLLLEASLMRNDVICYRPNDKKYFIGNKLECTEQVNTKQYLKEILNGKKIYNKNIGHLHDGAKLQIEKFINELVL